MKHTLSIICILASIITLWNDAYAFVRRDQKIALKVPDGYIVEEPQTNEWIREDFHFIVHSRRFAQGNAAYFEIYPAQNNRGWNSVECVFGQRKVFITKEKWGYRGFFAIPPDCNPGKQGFSITRVKDGKTITDYFTIKIAKSHFKEARRPIHLGKFSCVGCKLNPEIEAFIGECADKKKEAFSSMNPDAIGPSLAHPRNMHYITSPFWAKRYYKRYVVEKGRRRYISPRKNHHSGIDLRGKKGEPVFAIADGTVVLSELMYYEGNFIIIDHGNRVFSYYMHQTSLAVKAGQRVRAGDQIGCIGSTGISTGDHLHVALIINDVHVDPLSILSLPVKN